MTMRIRAAVARAKAAPMSLETVELAEPRSDEVLVRIAATGICHADLFIRDQVYPVEQPIVLGHEGAGTVERVGSAVTKVTPGDHVVMSFNSCGRCDSCRLRLKGFAEAGITDPAVYVSSGSTH